MKRADKARWVAALRSGEYKQGYSALACEGSMSPGVPARFCCLGVACEVFDVPRMWNGMTFLYDGESAKLPHDLRTRLGVSRSVEVILYNASGVTFYETLISLNDDAGLTFSQIADVIEYFFKVDADNTDGLTPNPEDHLNGRK